MSTRRLIAFSGYAIYSLPVGRGQRFLSNAGPWLQALLGGWNTSWNTVIQSGRVFYPGLLGL